MSNELTKVEQREVATQTAKLNPTSSYEMFLQLAKDETVPLERISALMDMQLKAETHWAEKQFNAAYAEMLPKIPRIAKNGKIRLIKDGVDKGSVPFAKLEDIDRIVRPIYTAHGFSLTFRSKATPQGIIRVAVLSHCDGHSIESEMQLPPDKGPGRNDLQALGSAMSYADRYLTRGLLNIICEGEDNDGKSFGTKFIDEATVMQLEDEMAGLDFTDKQRDAFMTFMQVKSLSEIPVSALPPARNYLGLMRRKAQR